ncbi:hypothetical protein MGU_06686 [Metarhizium guizhouense ARSEF 977]|uniref:Uncharacterized protein n=1 Tax=Metarhizium guizhouense (strain ARSEF 977) TaxID=1276136 RepID=A0A0B4GUA8_METGA|nr:hypothetical protein MGU_06686 [Metarhizium guizhouense ARSEF 977]
MFLPRLALVASVLVSSIAASPYKTHSVEKRGQNVIIGYRTVAEAQARDYIKAKTLTLTKAPVGIQIGTGVYTSPAPGEWPGGPTSWYCAILADAEALANTAKAWVPSTYWFKGDGEIDSFIKAQGLDPLKTMRMSLIDGLESRQQMVIPTGLLNNNGGGLSLSVLCKQNVAELPSARVDYESEHFKKNAKGEAQKPAPNPCKRAGAGDCVEEAAEEGAAEETAVEEGAAEEVAVEEGVVEGAAGNLIRDADLQAALKAGQVGEYRFFAEGLESAGGAAIEGAALDAVIAEADAAAVSVAAEDAAAEAVLAEAGETSIIGELLRVVIEVAEV